MKTYWPFLLMFIFKLEATPAPLTLSGRLITVCYTFGSNVTAVDDASCTGSLAEVTLMPRLESGCCIDALCSPAPTILLTRISPVIPSKFRGFGLTLSRLTCNPELAIDAEPLLLVKLLFFLIEELTASCDELMKVES